MPSGVANGAGAGAASATPDRIVRSVYLSSPSSATLPRKTTVGAGASSKPTTPAALLPARGLGVGGTPRNKSTAGAGAASAAGGSGGAGAGASGASGGSEREAAELAEYRARLAEQRRLARERQKARELQEQQEKEQESQQVPTSSAPAPDSAPLPSAAAAPALATTDGERASASCSNAAAAEAENAGSASSGADHMLSTTSSERTNDSVYILLSRAVLQVTVYCAIHSYPI